MIGLAVKDALLKANEALRPLNARVGGVKSIKLNQGWSPVRPTPMPMAKNVAYDMVERTEVFAKSQDVRADVNVEFEIEQD